MASKMTALVLLGLSVCYAAAVGILGTLDSSATGTFATIGAIVLGVLWILRSVFLRMRSG